MSEKEKALILQAANGYAMPDSTCNSALRVDPKANCLNCPFPVCIYDNLKRCKK